MRVVIERSGGFAGIGKTQNISTDEMPAAEAQQLRELVDSADFYKLPSVIPANAPMPDAFQYKITVESERGTHTVQVGESAMPPALNSVLDWVKRAPK